MQPENITLSGETLKTSTASGFSQGLDVPIDAETLKTLMYVSKNFDKRPCELFDEDDVEIVSISEEPDCDCHGLKGAEVDMVYYNGCNSKVVVRCISELLKKGAKLNSLAEQDYEELTLHNENVYARLTSDGKTYSIRRTDKVRSICRCIKLIKKNGTIDKIGYNQAPYKKVGFMRALLFSLFELLKEVYEITENDFLSISVYRYYNEINHFVDKDYVSNKKNTDNPDKVERNEEKVRLCRRKIVSEREKLKTLIEKIKLQQGLEWIDNLNENCEKILAGLGCCSKNSKSSIDEKNKKLEEIVIHLTKINKGLGEKIQKDTNCPDPNNLETVKKLLFKAFVLLKKKLDADVNLGKYFGTDVRNNWYYYTSETYEKFEDEYETRFSESKIIQINVGTKHFPTTLNVVEMLQAFYGWFEVDERELKNITGLFYIDGWKSVCERFKANVDKSVKRDVAGWAKMSVKNGKSVCDYLGSYADSISNNQADLVSGRSLNYKDAADKTK